MSSIQPGRAALLIAGILAAAPAIAQHQGHDMSAMPGMAMPAQKPASKKAVAKKPAAKPRKAATSATLKHRAGGAAQSKAPAGKPANAHAGPNIDGTHHAVSADRSSDVATPASGSTAPAAASGHTDHDASRSDGHDMSSMPGMDMSGMDHSRMSRSTATAPDSAHTDMHDRHAGANVPEAARDAAAAPSHDLHHSAHDVSSMPDMDMEGMDHSKMDMRGGSDAASRDLPADAAPREPIPVLTDADRAAAFPPVATGHPTHDAMTHSYWLADRLELRQGGEGGAWEGLAWIGRDVDRLWLRSEGEVDHGQVERGDLEVLYGHSITPWWDVVAGAKHEFGEGPSRTYAAFGVQGLAPYKFEVEATVFVGNGGRTAATLEAEYDTLITNRLILQWQGEANLYGRGDRAIGVGAGLSTVEAGARMRYEITRRFAPYVGVEYERAFGGTAGLRREEGAGVSDARVVAGIRFWF